MRYITGSGEDHYCTVPTAAAGERLDVFLVKQLSGTSRAFIQQLIRADLVQLSVGKCKTSYKVKGGETLTIRIPEPLEMSAAPENIPLDILFEDEFLLVVNKQPHLVVHPSPGHEGGTLVNALLYHCQDLSGIGGVFRPGIVHRLDRGTSGCIMVAKTDFAHRSLTAQFAARTVKKIYLAISEGHPRPATGVIENNLGRHPKHRQKQAILREGGRPSCTGYTTLETFGDYALVECKPKTGRTHQIRVHLKSVYAPILCDAEYGKGGILTAAGVRVKNPAAEKNEYGVPVLSRQALHASRLSFCHPQTEEKVSFHAPLPTDMEDALTVLRGM